MKCKDQEDFGLRGGPQMCENQVVFSLKLQLAEKDEFFGDTTGHFVVDIFCHAKYIVCNVSLHCYGCFVDCKWCGMFVRLLVVTVDDVI